MPEIQAIESLTLHCSSYISVTHPDNIKHSETNDFKDMVLSIALPHKLGFPLKQNLIRSDLRQKTMPVGKPDSQILFEKEQNIFSTFPYSDD